MKTNNNEVSSLSDSDFIRLHKALSILKTQKQLVSKIPVKKKIKFNVNDYDSLITSLIELVNIEGVKV